MASTANTSSVRQCPACFGSGGLDQMYHQGGKPVACATCKGKKFVILGLYCECGDCAIWYDPISKLRYCGDERCLKAAVARRGRVN